MLMLPRGGEWRKITHAADKTLINVLTNKKYKLNVDLVRGKNPSKDHNRDFLNLKPEDFDQTACLLESGHPH